MSYITIAAAGVQGGTGLYQAISGGIKQHNAIKGLENLKTPTVSPSKSINDYYQEALARYGASPYNSRLYQIQQKNALNNQATAINAATDRRSGVSSIGAINQQTNNALQSAGAAAEQQNAQRFSQLGQAANAKNANDQYVFGINSMMPYQKQSQLYSLKAGAGGQQLNAGIQNIAGAGQTLGETGMASKMYPNSGFTNGGQSGSIDNGVPTNYTTPSLGQQSTNPIGGVIYPNAPQQFMGNPISGL